MNENYDNTFGVKRKTKLKLNRSRFGLANGMVQQAQEFRCAHCHHYVSTDPVLSGVKNRNHCPYCLWSRHLDLFEAGDRLAACKAAMRPVGLTLKKSRKKYGKDYSGELMLIHLCVECGKASINRIAADDDAELIIDIFRSFEGLDPRTKAQLESEGILALSDEKAEIVQAQLLGLGSYSHYYSSLN